LERLESVIHRQKAVVTLNLQDENMVLHGDRFYWTQVLFNLVENALKQNPYKDLKIEVGADETERQVRVWVSDNGVGIPSADLPHIFRRFYRVDKQHSQMEIKGTGLGLSIVKRAIEAHQGVISVTSMPGRETKFLMTLPKNQI
jgi:signal transduction histidine kinase